jgi:hypothetical protein
MYYRNETAEYVKQHREEFEPFIEDDISFETYVNGLFQTGYYGGHISLVAFSRRFRFNIAIHQASQPIWYLNESEATPTLHLVYHNWEHYSSIRNIEGPHIGAADVSLTLSESKKEEKESPKEQWTETERRVFYASRCNDILLIRKYLQELNYDQDAVIEALYTHMYGPFNKESTPDTEDSEQTAIIPNLEESSIHQDPPQPTTLQLPPRQSHRRKRELAKRQRKANRMKTIQSRHQQQKIINMASCKIDQAVAQLQGIHI